MLFWKYVFWVSSFIIFYNYAGYGILLFLLNKFRRKHTGPATEDYYPSVSFIVAAFNEEDCIEKKIINSLQLTYPTDKIEFIFITDGSADATPDIVRMYPSVQLLHSKERKGKTSALNRAVLSARNEILIFSDANTILNQEACFNIAKHYSDQSVGGVAGEKKVIALENDLQNAASNEGFYWKYESLLKKLDSDFYTVVGAAGELFSVRKNLYEPVAPTVILDDFIISMKIAQKGYRVVYEPKAFAVELPSLSIEDEKKRKVRIAAGGFQAMALLPEALFFWKHFKLSFLYISHRVLRWTLSPLALLLAFLSSLMVTIFSPGHFIYTILLSMQVLFYLGGFAFGVFPAIGQLFPILRLPYYFIFMNISVFQGFFKFLRKEQSSAWEKAKRSSYDLVEMKKL